MKNTTFRKKALLSSVAMLLVAIVALGSATFAWFTANPTVSATGLSAKATTAAGLSIVSQSEKDYWENAESEVVWDYSTVINSKLDELATDQTEVLTAPASCDYTQASGDPSFYTATALRESNYAAQGDDDEGNPVDNIASASDAATTAVYSEDIFFKSTIAGGDVTVQSVTVTLTAGTDADMAGTVRAMLVDADNNILGVWSTSAKTNAYIHNENGTKSLVNDYTTLTSGTVKNGLSLAANGGAENYVTLYVWIDGEDTACNTNAVTLDSTILDTIKVELSTNA